MTKVPLAKHNDMVEAIPSDRSNEPLRTSVLPWGACCSRPIANTHRLQPTENDVAIDAITVANDVAGRLLPPICLGQLAGNPFRSRMRRGTHPQKLATTVLQDQQSVQQPKRDGRDQEQIHRCDAVGVIAQEGLPALRRRSPPPRHVLCNRSLSDIDAELEQFPVYPGRTPKWVCNAHLADQAANVCRYRRPATQRSGFPTPIGSEPSAVPAQQRRRPYDLQSVQHPRSQAIEANKQQPVYAAEGQALRATAAQNVELVPKHEDFGFQRSPRSEQPDQGAPDQSAKIAHRSNYRPIRQCQSLLWVCGRDTPLKILFRQHRSFASFPSMESVCFTPKPDVGSGRSVRRYVPYPDKGVHGQSVLGCQRRNALNVRARHIASGPMTVQPGRLLARSQ